MAGTVLTDAFAASWHAAGPALILAGAGLVPIVMARTPRAAIGLAILLCAAAAALSLEVSSYEGAVLAVFAFVYSLAIIAGLRHSQKLAATRSDAERRIHRHEEILSLALDDAGESAGGWSWETDRQGRLTHISHGLAAGLGRPAAEFIGKDFVTLFAGSGAGWDRLLLSLDARQPISCVVELPLRSGRMWWQVTAGPIISGTGADKGYRGIARDITAERVARRKLADERDALRRDNAGKSQFLALMAHQLRTSLNTIVGYAELLLSPQASRMTEARHHEHLATLRDTSHHMQRLVADILDAIRIENGNLRLVEQEADAAEISEVAAKLCREAAEKSEVTIMASLIDGIELNCDATRIKQALVNLMTNALQASSPGSTIRVDFEFPPDGGLAIAVHDTGPGIGPGAMAHIFHPFGQADAVTGRGSGGIGLGLPIARQIALLHGGDVTIESAEGAGTTARLILPATRVKWPAEIQPEANCAA